VAKKRRGHGRPAVDAKCSRAVSGVQQTWRGGNHSVAAAGQIRPSDGPILRVRVGFRTITPVEGVVIQLAGAVGEIVQCQLGLKGLTLGIVSERAPLDRIVVVGPEQPAGLDHRISNPSARLVEHQSLDGAEPGAVAAVNGDVLHAITAAGASIRYERPASLNPSSP